MATAAKVGPVGERVAENVKRLRGREHVSVRELSKRLQAAGRPILPSGITKLEQGARRVDVDDLVELARALGVSPLRLMEDPRSKPVDLEALDTDGTVSEALRATARVVDTGVSLDEFFEAVKVSEGVRVVFGHDVGRFVDAAERPRSESPGGRRGSPSTRDRTAVSK